VPDLARLPYERAERLADRDGLHLSRAGERFDTEVPRGGILSQEPLAGTRVRNGARVSVTLSLGRSRATSRCSPDRRVAARSCCSSAPDSRSVV
jgi:beta-lactam-binding protein with PASTA domain